MYNIIQKLSLLSIKLKLLEYLPLKISNGPKSMGKEDVLLFPPVRTDRLPEQRTMKGLAWVTLFFFLLLKVWCTDPQHWHHLGTCQKYILLHVVCMHIKVLRCKLVIITFKLNTFLLHNSKWLIVIITFKLKTGRQWDRQVNRLTGPMNKYQEFSHNKN